MKPIVRIPFVWGCPICGGKRHSRIEKHILKRREKAQWKKDWKRNGY